MTFSDTVFGLYPLLVDSVDANNVITWKDGHTTTAEENNACIETHLEVLDRKSIRALRSGETTRLQAIEAEAILLRGKLK